MTKTFEVGDTVRWKSQARGRIREKVGTVLAVVPPDKTGRDMIHHVCLERPPKIMFDGAAPRREISYLVAVPSKTGKGKASLYWPHTSCLESIHDEKHPPG